MPGQACRRAEAANSVRMRAIVERTVLRSSCSPSVLRYRSQLARRSIPWTTARMNAKWPEVNLRGLVATDIGKAGNPAVRRTSQDYWRWRRAVLRRAGLRAARAGSGWSRVKLWDERPARAGRRPAARSRRVGEPFVSHRVRCRTDRRQSMEHTLFGPGRVASQPRCASLRARPKGDVPQSAEPVS